MSGQMLIQPVATALADIPFYALCDTCHDPIERPEEGVVEWLADEALRAHGFRVAHRGNCQVYSAPDYAGPGHVRHEPLANFLGSNGLNYWLEELEDGDIRDAPGLARLLRRLHFGLDGRATAAE